MFRLVAFLLKFAFYTVFWVFFLSLSWEDKSIYERLQPVIADKNFIHSMSEKASQLWYDGSDFVEKMPSNLLGKLSNKAQ